MLVLCAHLEAGNQIARALAWRRGALFGLHRLTLNVLAYQLALPKLVAAGSTRGFEIGARRCEQTIRADDIGPHEAVRVVNGPVDMTFGREVDDGSWPVLVEQRSDKLQVRDVAPNKAMPRIIEHRLQTLQISRVSQLIQIDNGLVAGLEPLQNEVDPDEARATGYQDCQLRLPKG